VACGRTKAAISLKRVKVEEKSYYGGSIRTHRRSFERYHPDPLWPPLLLDWGLQLIYPLLIPGTGKATDFKFCGYIYRANPNKSPLKFFSEKGAWAYPGTAQFFGVPLLSQERVKLWTSNLAGTFTGPIRIKTH